ncbi:MAG: OmpH family outer membrane protein [Bacteroidetes bacterium]|nr:OmpH family outer membrane protein [Bacteroidota bacterium]
MGFLSALLMSKFTKSLIFIDKMPEYILASDNIDQQIKQWESEVDVKFQEVENLYQDYVKNEMLYPEDVKIEKQNGIVDAEKKAKEFREKIFGQNGELSKLQDAKINPLEEKILQAAEKVGKENNYEYIFDKRPETSWIYTSPEHDLTEKVLIELGLNK